MESEGSIRRQAGCAILIVFDLMALCVLAYLALGAGMFFPAHCYENPQCEAARDESVQLVVIAFWTTTAVNVGFLAWAVLTRKR